MKPDKTLVKHLLGILRRIGPVGMQEQSLMAELETAAGKPLTTAVAKDVILFASDKGWIASRCDDFDCTIYWLSDIGKTVYLGL